MRACREHPSATRTLGTTPGGEWAKWAELGPVEGIGCARNAVDCTGYDGIRHGSDGSERIVETNMLRREGHNGEGVKSGDVEGNGMRRIDADSIHRGGR